MDDSRHRENGRHKADQYRSIHTQWMIPQHQMKDNQAMKIMTIMAERDNAIQERNIALAEKKAAMAERDMAILQRDAAIAERNTAIMERDNAIAALEYAREGGIDVNGGAKHVHQLHHHHLHLQPPSQLQLANEPYNHSREMHVVEACPIATSTEGAIKMPKMKRPRKDSHSPKKTANKPRKSKRGCGDEDLSRQRSAKSQNEWKDQGLGLNQVTFDDTTMPGPVCSCTGKYQPCYKWGNGGWQSACCTTTLSMYPLPLMPHKKHARVGGRKMSGSAFTKLLSKLAAEGHDLAMPVDLKDHWAKHGTNRYITIK